MLVDFAALGALEAWFERFAAYQTSMRPTDPLIEQGEAERLRDLIADVHETLSAGDLGAGTVADLDLPAAATRFSFGTVGGPNAQEQIDVELRPGLDEHGRPVMRWAVVCFDWVFNRQHGRWTYAKDDCWMPEPIPSYRDDEYLDAHRYNTLDEAIAAAKGLLADGHPYAGPWTRRRLDD